MKWMLLLLVSSVAAADPLPVTAMVGGGWRSASGTPSPPPGTPYGQLIPGNEQDLGTFEGAVLARLSPHVAIGLKASVSSTIGANGAIYGNESGMSVAVLVRPVTIALAGQYQYGRLWVMPWVGRELVHARYELDSYDTHSGMTRRTFAQMSSQQRTASGLPTSFGLGFQLTWFDGMPVVFHSGGQPGVSDIVIMVPSKKIAVVVLTNESDVKDILAIAEAIARHELN